MLSTPVPVCRPVRTHYAYRPGAPAILDRADTIRVQRRWRWPVVLETVNLWKNEDGCQHTDQRAYGNEQRRPALADCGNQR